MMDISAESTPAHPMPEGDFASATPPRPEAASDATLSSGHAGQWELPTARRTLLRLLRAWIIGLSVFGYGPAFTYGWLIWLLNPYQWFWVYLMYFTLVPLIGGFFVVFLPWQSYRPIHQAIKDWSHGVPVDRQRCIMVYELALRLPWRIAIGSFSTALIGYLIGTTIVHWQSNQPVIEMIPKTLPAIPLVGGMMGAFCYFGTIRALHPVVTWCSLQLRHARPIRRVSLATKFLITTCILAIAVLCLLVPSAYRLGQVITERDLSDQTLTQLRTTVQRAMLFERMEDRLGLLQSAKVGPNGYVFAIDDQGRMVTTHPRGYTRLAQEQFYHVEEQLEGPQGAWVDRVGQHRVVAFVRAHDPSWTVFSVSFPTDFSLPLQQFVQFSWVVVVEVLFVVILFGRYYTRGITTPLAELTLAARRIAEHGDLSQHVPVTTNDELGEVARSFNRMVEELQASKADLVEYTKRLERSTRELSALNLEMEDLLRVVSHDLRAPLINIQGFSKRLEPIMQETLTVLDQLAQQSSENGLRTRVDAVKGTMHARFSESMRFISKGVEKMDALLSSLLAVSRVGRKADPVQPNDLDEILDDVLAMFDHQLKEQAIQVIRHPLPKQVLCRRNEINQVFSNLILNAINYMGAKGDRFIEIGGIERDENMECYIRDTGIGIHPDDHERIFQMFTRLQAVDVPGEGVGLAYVKKILRSHGGKIWVVSQKGQGSTFSFTLPTRPPALLRPVGTWTAERG